MATYTPVPKEVPSLERTTVITAVAAGDRIDVRDVLGRSARKVQFIAANSTDVVEYRLNNLRRVRQEVPTPYGKNQALQAWGVNSNDFEEKLIWEEVGPSFSTTGAAFETVDGLKISSIEVISLTGPTTISIVVS